MSEYIYASNGEPLTNARWEIALARHEIVRCRDCKHSRDGDGALMWCSFNTVHVVQNDYCSDGVRADA